MVEMCPAVENFREELQKLLDENFAVETKVGTGIRYTTPSGYPIVILNAIIERFDETIQMIFSFTEPHYNWIMRFIDELQSIANIQKIEFSKELLGLPSR